MIKKLLKIFLWIGSCDGEDKMLLQLLPKTGTYLDIGCSQPIKYSNTFLLYLRGWKGTCVDTRKIRRFKWFRPRDTFLQANVQSLDEYTGLDEKVDFLDLDVDGIELHLLRTMSFKPKWILVENNLDTQEFVDTYLSSAGYNKKFQTLQNGLYERNT